jgi:hypothetical protein
MMIGRFKTANAQLREEKEFHRSELTTVKELLKLWHGDFRVEQTEPVGLGRFILRRWCLLIFLVKAHKKALCGKWPYLMLWVVEVEKERLARKRKLSSQTSGTRVMLDECTHMNMKTLILSTPQGR